MTGAKTDMSDEGFHDLFCDALFAEQLTKSAGASDLVKQKVIDEVSAMLPNDENCERQVGSPEVDEHADKNTGSTAGSFPSFTCSPSFGSLHLLCVRLSIYTTVSVHCVRVSLDHKPSQIKEECTPRKKVYDDKGSRLENPRFRVLNVQTFEDGLMARIITSQQCKAEKDSFSSCYSPAGSPVLVGSGHVGVGNNLFWRHFLQVEGTERMVPDVR